MVDESAARYIAIVKDEIGGRLLPALEPGLHQQIAMCSQFILAELVTGSRHLPELLSEAINGFAALIEPLNMNDDSSKRLAGDLEILRNSNQDVRSVLAFAHKIAQDVAAKPDQAAACLLKQIVGIEDRLQSAFLSAYLEEISRSAIDATTKDVLSKQQIAQLREWMIAQFPGNTGLEIGGLKLIPGGFSKQTIFISLKNAATLPTDLVIRLDWTASSVGSTVVDEFRIIEILFNAGVKVPQPYALEATGDVLGGPFLLMSKAEGRNLGDALDVRGGTKAFALDLAKSMAKLHAVPPRSFGDSVAGAGESIHQRMLREIAKSEADWRRLDEPSASMEAAFGWLKRHIHLADGPRALIHKDIGCHNMLAIEDRVSVLLDWETAAIGNPAQDLGYVYPSVIQMCDWRDFMVAYAEAGGFEPSQEQIDYYTLWGFTWVNTLLLQTRAMFNAGLANDVRIGFAGTYLVARTEARLREKLYSLL